MNSSQPLINLEPEITQRLRNACRNYIDNVKWYRSSNEHTAIAKKILQYLDRHFDTSSEFMKLVSACFIHALKDVLISLDSETFSELLNNELKHIDLPDVSDAKMQKIIATVKTQLLPNSLPILLFDGTPLVIQAMQVDLKNENGHGSLAKYFLRMKSITNYSTDQEYENLIDAFIIAAVKIENFELLPMIVLQFQSRRNTMYHSFSFLTTFIFRKAFEASLDIPIQTTLESMDTHSFTVPDILKNKNISKCPDITLRLIRYFAEQDYNITDFWSYAGSYAISMNDIKLIITILDTAICNHDSNFYLPLLSEAVINDRLKICAYILEKYQHKNLLTFDIENQQGILTAIIMLDNLPLLEERLPALLNWDSHYTCNFDLEDFLLTTMINQRQISMLQWMLDAHFGLPLKINAKLLYKMAEILLIKEEKLPVDWDIINHIVTDKRFDPNYDPHHIMHELSAEKTPLVQNKITLYHAAKNDNYVSMNGFLQNASFFASERDWKNWAKQNRIQRDNFQQILTINRCWHQLRTFHPMAPQYLDQDIIMQIANLLYLVSVLGNPVMNPPRYIGLFQENKDANVILESTQLSLSKKS